MYVDHIQYNTIVGFQMAVHDQHTLIFYSKIYKYLHKWDKWTLSTVSYRIWSGFDSVWFQINQVLLSKELLCMYVYVCIFSELFGLHNCA